MNDNYTKHFSNNDVRQVLRYYVTGIGLEYRGNQDIALGRSKNSSLGCIGCYDPKDVLRSPLLAVIPPIKGDKSDRFVECEFAVIPAQGFVKEKGQPVCYGDPVQLIDQKGRLLSKVNRFPYFGHIGVDGTSGCLVTSFVHPMNENQEPSIEREKIVDVVCGDQVVLHGITVARKKNFIGGCLMYDASGDSSLSYHIVLKSCELSSELFVRPQQTIPSIEADRTPCGYFVGAVHSGYLHKRANLTKKWNLRYFVLTHLALHHWKSAPGQSMVSKLQKSRGRTLVSAIASIEYDSIASPHNLVIKKKSGKEIQLHSTNAIECYNWAQVLKIGITNPEWIHADGVFTTVWKSDKLFNSSKCPKVVRIEIIYQNEDSKKKILKEDPLWDEDIPIGMMYADSLLKIVLQNDIFVYLTLTHLNEAVLTSKWIHVDNWEVNNIKGLTASMEYISKISSRSTESVPTFHSLVQNYPALSCGLALLLLLGVTFGSFLPLYSGVFIGFVALGLVVTIFRKHLHDNANSMKISIEWSLALRSFEVKPKLSHTSISQSLRPSSLSEDSMKSSNDVQQEHLSDTETESVSSSEFKGNSNTSPKSDVSSFDVVGFHPRWTNDGVSKFYLENGLEMIMQLPPLNYFALKKCVVHYFLGDICSKRSTLVIEFGQSNWKELERMQLSIFDLLRHFYFLWDYLNTKSSLKQVVDVSNRVEIVCPSKTLQWLWKLFTLDMECSVVIRGDPLEGPSLEGPPLKGPSLESPPLEGPPLEGNGKKDLMMDKCFVNHTFVNHTNKENELDEFVGDLLSKYVQDTIPGISSDDAYQLRTIFIKEFPEKELLFCKVDSDGLTKTMMGYMIISCDSSNTIMNWLQNYSLLWRKSLVDFRVLKRILISRNNQDAIYQCYQCPVCSTCHRSFLKRYCDDSTTLVVQGKDGRDIYCIEKYNDDYKLNFSIQIIPCCHAFELLSNSIVCELKELRHQIMGSLKEKDLDPKKNRSSHHFNQPML